MLYRTYTLPCPALPASLAPYILCVILVGLQKVVKLLVEPKHSCVTITGERGSGKTERAIQACDYVRERHHFDAVHWADCNNVVEAEAGLYCPAPPPFSADSPGSLNGSSHSASDPCRLVSDWKFHGKDVWMCA